MTKALSAILGTLLIAFSAIVAYDLFSDRQIAHPRVLPIQQVSNSYNQLYPNPPNYQLPSNVPTVTIPMADFTSVAENVTPAVVHIKTTGANSSGGRSPNSLFDLFGGNPNDDEGAKRTLSSGSGVILSQEGYIVTNKHVIEDAEEISVILNDRRTYIAKVVGFDPHTDLAVIKINETNLPTLNYGNSDQVKVGEWVVAVGNPFNLASTVTTGIVSAKTRKIGMSGDELAIESFIQTDAAVNPGNSGGALVDLKGNLIGINTAIATPTGYYAGYSFALPVNIVQKVVGDILTYGSVKRGYLGVGIVDVSSQLAKERGFNNANGVYISKVTPRSAASTGGIKEGDVIIKIQEFVVNNSAELQEIVSRYHPGDQLAITLKRDNTVMMVDVELKGEY